MSNIKQLVLASLFVALGVVTPMAFHSVGLGGPVALPMHLPVLIAAFILKPKYAVLVGGLTPIFSSILTGMPPTFPMLPIMFFELMTYALVASIMYNKYQINIYISLIVSMIIGRIVAGIVVTVLSTFFGAQLPPMLTFITGAVTTGMIGIIIQLVVVPPIAYATNKIVK